MEHEYCYNCMEAMPEEAQQCAHCGMVPGGFQSWFHAMAPGSILRDRYLVGKVLGQGGFGITYLGLDRVLQMKVAIKEFFPGCGVSRDRAHSNALHWDDPNSAISQADGCQLFLKEARKMARLRNIPTIVQVLDMFEENNTAYIVMEFVQGQTLGSYLRERGTLTFDSCLTLLRPLMEDLVRVHSHGLIHRDISPDNIMLREDGGICLLDLGAAKDVRLRGGQSTQIVQKPGFSPLEQYAAGSHIGPWTDVYALCATICYCMTGRAIPSAFDRMYNPEQVFPDLTGKLLPGQWEALEHGLAVQAERRTQTVRQLLEELEGVPHSPVPERILSARIPVAPIPPTQPVEEPPAVPARPGKSAGEKGKNPRKHQNKKKMWIAVILAALALLAGGLAVKGQIPSQRQSAKSMQVETAALTYTYLEAQSGWEVRRTEGASIIGTLSIPDQVEGIPVVAVGEEGFRETAIEAVVIPEGVTAIGAAAFENCTSLTSVTIPQGMQAIGQRAFFGCAALREAFLPPSVAAVESGVFAGCASLKKVTLSQGIAAIGESAFNGCTMLTGIRIPDSIRSIGYLAFHNSGITEITVAKGTAVDKTLKMTGTVTVNYR